MIKKVKFVQLHEPLFLAGVNFGNKLQPRSGKGMLDLSHDSVSDHVLVNFNGEVAHIKNWASFNEDSGVPEQTFVEKMTLSSPVKAQASGPGLGLHKSAQVETPHDKVQGTPKKKAKFQGEETQGE